MSRAEALQTRPVLSASCCVFYPLRKHMPPDVLLTPSGWISRGDLEGSDVGSGVTTTSVLCQHLECEGIMRI